MALNLKPFLPLKHPGVTYPLLPLFNDPHSPSAEDSMKHQSESNLEYKLYLEKIKKKDSNKRSRLKELDIID